MVTKNSMSQAVAFIILLLLGGIGDAVVQDSFNKVQLMPAGAVA
jgi:hypothetical protein